MLYENILQKKQILGPAAIEYSWNDHETTNRYISKDEFSKIV